MQLALAKYHLGSLLTRSQIEQKIDTMYPRQDPKKILAAQNQGEQEREPGMDPKEGIFLLLAVLGVLLLVGGLMVGRLHLRLCGPSMRPSGPKIVDVLIFPS
jgi:hypothetical protein